MSASHLIGEKHFEDNVGENADGILGYQLSKAIVAQKKNKRQGLYCPGQQGLKFRNRILLRLRSEKKKGKGSTNKNQQGESIPSMLLVLLQGFGLRLVRLEMNGISEGFV